MSTHLPSVVRWFNFITNFTFPWPHHKVEEMFLKNFISNRDELVKSTEAMQDRNENKPEDYLLWNDGGKKRHTADIV